MNHTSAESQVRWRQYYDVVAGRPPREFLRNLLRRFYAAGAAIDLGCGTGTESFFLLEQGWQVLAVDQQETAIQALQATASPTVADRLQTLVASFEMVELPSANLIWAGLSLPFCHPAHFDALWSNIGAALIPGGRFAGDFFGPRHAWSSEQRMTFHTKDQIIAMCDGLHLEYIQEGEGEMLTALDGIQHWHIFTICARKLQTQIL
jgi:SAM-dependent methyltransferase